MNENQIRADLLQLDELSSLAEFRHGGKVI